MRLESDGRVGGKVVSVFAFYSVNLSLIPAIVYTFYDVKAGGKETKRGQEWLY